MSAVLIAIGAVFALAGLVAIAAAFGAAKLRRLRDGSDGGGES